VHAVSTQEELGERSSTWRKEKGRRESSAFKYCKDDAKENEK